MHLIGPQKPVATSSRAGLGRVRGSRFRPGRGAPAF